MNLFPKMTLFTLTQFHKKRQHYVVSIDIEPFDFTIRYGSQNVFSKEMLRTISNHVNFSLFTILVNHLGLKVFA